MIAPANPVQVYELAREHDLSLDEMKIVYADLHQSLVRCPNCFPNSQARYQLGELDECGA